jgi:hypothetical protein
VTTSILQRAHSRHAYIVFVDEAGFNARSGAAKDLGTARLHPGNQTGISTMDSSPTGNIHLTAPECNRSPDMKRSEHQRSTEEVRFAPSVAPEARNGFSCH